jgi:beta-N-acetylhexosaminidase
MQAVELVPFREAIRTGVDAVMTAHLAVPAYEPEEEPATVSEKVLTGLLRKDLEFSGLIVTDAMDMQGLTKQFPGGEAAVRALEAGADVLLMPPNPEVAIKAVLAAVKQGRLTEKRINESAMRILSAKARVGLHKNKLVNLEQISEVIDSADSEEQAQLAADKALTLVKNGNSLLPIQNAAGACIWVLAESRYGQQGRRFEDEVRSRFPNARMQHFDQQVLLSEMQEELQKASGCEAHIVAAYVAVAAYRGNVSLGGGYPEFMEALRATGVPVALVALGNPYLLRSFPWVNAYVATFSTVTTSETAVAKAIFGAIPMTGRLPVTIPGLAKYGEAAGAPSNSN